MIKNKGPYRLWDSETRRTLGFFVAKGLLLVPDITPMPTVKLDIEKVLQLGLEIEPRVLEAFPAALLHFPRSFINWQSLPQKIQAVLDALKKGKETGPNLAGIPYESMKRWADKQLKDGRAIPEKDRRIMKSFRFSRSAIAKLKTRASTANTTETEVLEKMILSD